ncbi:hypothetical protein A0J61_10735, partial [Choanephora cucurbitarum]
MKYQDFSQFFENNEDVSLTSFIKQYASTVRSLYEADSVNYKKNLIQTYSLQLKKKRPLLSNAERSKLSKVEEQVWKEVEKDDYAAQSATGPSTSKTETLETLSSSNTGLKRKASKANLTMKDISVDDEHIDHIWIIDDVSITDAFKAYQKEALNFCKENDGHLNLSQNLNEL